TRVRGAAAAGWALAFPFTLTARAENYLHGRPDLNDTIARLQAYQDAGADVLYAPGLTSKEEIADVVRSVDRPVNVVMGLRGVQLSVAELSQLGVRRISVGSALYRTALGAFLRAAREMRDHGTFTFAADAASPREISEILKYLAATPLPASRERQRAEFLTPATHSNQHSIAACRAIIFYWTTVHFDPNLPTSFKRDVSPCES